jgi:hypothetical protein
LSAGTKNVNKNDINSETITRYLLDDLPEDARAALEDSFLGDEELFAQIADAENDLVDDYVAGHLNAKNRALFETNYLALPENREKVAAAKLLLENRKLVSSSVTGDSAARQEDKASFWQSIGAFFVSWQFAPLAVVVLLLLFGGLWFALRQNPNEEIAFQPVPTPVLQPTPELKPSQTFAPPANSNVAASPAPDLTPPASPRPTPKHEPQKETPTSNAAPKDETSRPPQTEKTPVSLTRIVTLALVAGSVRGEGGAANSLVIPKNARFIQMFFDLPKANYKQIEARIETVAGERVWSGKINRSAGRVSLNVPAEFFADEDYLLLLSGENSGGEREDFQNFYFNSRRK